MDGNEHGDLRRPPGAGAPAPGHPAARVTGEQCLHSSHPTLGATGAGTTGSLTFFGGFTLAGSASVAANRATFLVDVNGLNAGAATNGHDALLATGGIVSINGATLAFGAFTGAYAFGDRITLIDGSGTASLAGTFFDPSGNALANGSTVPDLGGRGGQTAWQIFYSGQDAYITPIPEPARPSARAWGCSD